MIWVRKKILVAKKLKKFPKFKNYSEYYECLKEEIFYQMKIATNTDLLPVIIIVV